MIKIAITGPESSGKTTLALGLTKHFDAHFVKEYAREYLNELNGEYQQSDLIEIARGHLKNVQLSQKSIQFVDSDFVVLHVWSEFRYGNVDNEILKLAKCNMFDLHILCSPDIPWEKDALRENPNDRGTLFDLYKRCLNDFGKNYIIVNGSHEERMQKSISEINNLLK